MVYTNYDSEVASGQLLLIMLFISVKFYEILTKNCSSSSYHKQIDFKTKELLPLTLAMLNKLRCHTHF